jgi:hypothetical protein
MDQMIQEAIEINHHHDNMNRDAGFCLSQSWKSIILSLKGCRKPLPWTERLY